MQLDLRKNTRLDFVQWHIYARSRAWDEEGGRERGRNKTGEAFEFKGFL